MSSDMDNNVGGRFTRLDEEMDDLRPLGHDVKVGHGGDDVEGGGGQAGGAGGGGGIGMEVPSSGIGVKTDVIVETSGRYAYNDRLY